MATQTKTRTITIYERTCRQAQSISETGTSYSLSPWGSNTRLYKGSDDGGHEYMLPDGVEEASLYGSPILVDSDGYHIDIYSKHGAPHIVVGGLEHKLERA